LSIILSILLTISKTPSFPLSLLIIGDVFGASTHIDIFQRAKERKIKVNIIHNTSILTAIGETGLSLYNFGKTTSIPFENKDITSPIKALQDNQKIGLHTLFLLDLDPDNNKFLSIKDASKYLIINKIDEKTLSIACCALGTNKQKITNKSLKAFSELDFDIFPQCMIIPGKLHFVEEEFLKTLK